MTERADELLERWRDAGWTIRATAGGTRLIARRGDLQVFARDPAELAENLSHATVRSARPAPRYDPATAPFPKGF